MKTSFFTILLSFVCLNFYSQDFFIVNSDTTFCSNLKYSNTKQGKLISLSYTNEEGVDIQLEKENIPDVQTFFQNGYTTDKMPGYLDKPNVNYFQFDDRKIDGTIKGYIGNSSQNQVARQYYKLPDGTYIIEGKIKDIKRLMAYLLACSEFKSNYKGNFSDLDEAVRLYNSLCE